MPQIPKSRTRWPHYSLAADSLRRTNDGRKESCASVPLLGDQSVLSTQGREAELLELA